jgi:hypothetical protein
LTDTRNWVLDVGDAAGAADGADTPDVASVAGGGTTDLAAAGKGGGGGFDTAERAAGGGGGFGSIFVFQCREGDRISHEHVTETLRDARRVEGLGPGSSGPLPFCSCASIVNA